jgi:hypothetical protein
MKSNYLIIFSIPLYFWFLKVLWRGCNEKESGLPIPGVNIQIKNSTKVLPQILMVNSL